MGNKVVFTSVKTKSVKNAHLEKDSDGYYTITLGALNVYNSAGNYYALDGAKELFAGSSSLMRRINNGFLKAETGHPKRTPGSTIGEFMSRILRIEESNVCAHIKEVTLEETNEKEPGSNANIVLIVGKVKPEGPMMDALVTALENPEANVAFSIRSITNDRMVNGVIVKTLKNIVTWDFVTEPGISRATKWQTLGIEDLELFAADLDDPITMRSLMHDLEEEALVSTESNGALLVEVMNGMHCSLPKKSIMDEWGNI